MKKIKIIIAVFLLAIFSTNLKLNSAYNSLCKNMELNSSYVSKEKPLGEGVNNVESI